LTSGIAPDQNCDANFAQAYLTQFNGVVKEILKAVANTAAVSSSEELATLRKPPAGEPIDDGGIGLDGMHVRALHREFVLCFRSLRPAKLVEQCLDMAWGLADQVNAVQGGGDPATLTNESPLQTCCTLQSQLFPFLSLYIASCDQLLLDFLVFHKAVCKLQYITSGVFLELFQRGFCLPADETDGEGEDHGGQDLDGNGMADGTGSKDVSDQIEDEEQILGTKDEEKDDQPDPGTVPSRPHCPHCL
jgi:hypothetical protein